MGSRIKSLLYARLEETSFRSGAAFCVVALALAAVAVTLAVTLGGQSAARPRAAGADPGPGSAVPSASAPPGSPARAARPASHPATGIAPAANEVPEPGAGPPASSAPSGAPLPGSSEPPWLRPLWRPADQPPGWMWLTAWDRQWPGQRWAHWDRHWHQHSDGGEPGSDS